MSRIMLIFGAALIGVAADVLVRSSAVPAVASGGSWVLSACLAGTAGMFADSLLGATLEDRWGLLGNDEVNLGCTLVGATAGWALGSVGG